MEGSKLMDSSRWSRADADEHGILAPAPAAAAEEAAHASVLIAVWCASLMRTVGSLTRGSNS